MSNRVIIAALLLVLSSASCLHEGVVDGVISSVSRDIIKTKTELSDYRYVLRQQIGPVTSSLVGSLFMGRLVVEGLERTGTVEYTSSNGVASFVYTAGLKVFMAFRYRFTASDTSISSGTATASWHSSLNMKMDVGSDGCGLSLRKAQRNTTLFDLDVVPTDGKLYPVTFHLPAGNTLEVHVQSTLQKALESAINGKKVCDCIDCNM